MSHEYGPGRLQNGTARLVLQDPRQAWVNVNRYIISLPPEPKPDFEAMKKTIIGDMTDKELNTLVCRAFKAGLSVESVAWVFKIPESEVHRIIREAL